MGGLFLLGAGGTLWLSSDLRDEWRKLDEIQTEIREAVAAQTAALEAQSAALAALGNGHDRRPRPLTPSARGRRDSEDA